MDRKKVILIGADRSHDWIAKALGEMAHYDVERFDIMDGLEGRNPHVSFFDELSKPLLINLDFSKLENHFAGMYDAVLTDGTAIMDSMSGRTYTGRDIFWDPELQHLPSRKLHALDDVAHTNRVFAKGYDPSLIIWDDYGPRVIQKAADHPSRKREPKGPRGKWGKL